MHEIISGYFSFDEILKDGQKALDNGLYRIAFLLALTIPSVCSRIEFQYDPEYQDDGYWKDKKCYIDWCMMQGIKFLDSENKNRENAPTDLEYCNHIYDIRCFVVHENIVHCDYKECNLCVNEDPEICKKANCNRVNQYDICVVPFCKQMFKIGWKYYKEHMVEFEANRQPMKTYIEGKEKYG